MVLSSYSHLQDKIAAALRAEDWLIAEMIKHHLKKRARKALESLLKLDDDLYVSLN